MGRFGTALKQTLTTYRISQNKLAIALGIDRSVVFRWFHGHTDPTAEAIADIVLAIKQIEPAAAKRFVELYLWELVEDVEED